MKKEQILNGVKEEVKANIYTVEVDATLEEVNAKNALANALKAQIKKERIETEIENFDLKKIITRLENLVNFSQKYTDTKDIRHWYAKNTSEYRSPLFIFNQICKGGVDNPYNNPKELFKQHEISTKKYTGITMLAFMRLDLFLGQISLQGNYSPNMFKLAFNEADKKKAFELSDTTKAAIIKGAILNEAVKDYSNEKISLTQFIEQIKPYFTQKEWNDEKVVKALSTMLVTAEIAAETKADKDKKAEAKKAAKKK